MNTTSQTSKIGQLPKNIRHQLGCRIQAGQPDADLVEWLNAQDAVKETLSRNHAVGREVGAMQIFAQGQE